MDVVPKLPPIVATDLPDGFTTYQYKRLQFADNLLGCLAVGNHTFLLIGLGG